MKIVNAGLLMAAGLLAKKAVARGLSVKPWVKTSLAPGSKVVMEYLKKAGLLDSLEKLKFHLVGFGCTTCIGNSGPLPEAVGKVIKDNELVAAAVLSGNRNFEGRVNPLVRANYLASPPLVVAYAIAGTLNIDLATEPIASDKEGNPVFLKDLWPSQKEISEAMAFVDADMFKKQYAKVFEGDEAWRGLKIPIGDTFRWDEKSTYVKNPPYFENMPDNPKPLQDIRGARVLALLGDSVTTDHISPAGAIAKDSPAGKYLIEKIAKIPVINEIASEFRYREPLLSSKDLVIAISQSGETADVLEVLEIARKKGVKVALNNSLAFGGNNACTAFGNVE